MDYVEAKMVYIPYNHSNILPRTYLEYVNAIFQEITGFI
jgi:hypothetical protein